MKIRHFLSVSQMDPSEIAHLVNQSLVFAKDIPGKHRPLDGRVVGIYFRCSSTRTRSAFTVGAMKLGAQTVQYGPNDLQVATGETMHDTGRVLSNYLDSLVFRSNGNIKEMEDLADQNSMSVINAMSEEEHPSQSIADLTTIKEHFGRLDDIHVLYVGEGNNTTSALALAISKTPGMQLTIVTPEGYGLPCSFVSRVQSMGRELGSEIHQIHDLSKLPGNVDVVYTTRWQTMGVPKADLDWEKKFQPYSVTPEFMTAVSKPSGTIFMHDLPAVRGADVVNEVLDGPQSVAFRQAFHKISSAMSILNWCSTAQ